VSSSAVIKFECAIEPGPALVLSLYHAAGDRDRKIGDDGAHCCWIGEGQEVRATTRQRSCACRAYTRAAATGRIRELGR
jgi:hypothetical protein